MEWMNRVEFSSSTASLLEIGTKQLLSDSANYLIMGAMHMNVAGLKFRTIHRLNEAFIVDGILFS